MKQLLFNTIKNDLILVMAGFFTVILISLSFGANNIPPSKTSLKDPNIVSSQIIQELGITIVEFKNGLTCVVPFNKKSISCTNQNNNPSAN